MAGPQPPHGGRRAPHGGPRATTHWAHVAVVALHSICCGLPIIVSVAGLATGAALVGGVLRFHSILHNHELLVLGVSAALVSVGWLAERNNMRGAGRGVSKLFWVSLGCLAFNTAIVFGHRLAA